MTKRRPTHLPKEERRRQLLEAAVGEFGRRGYHRTQVSDIIRKAGVARGTFYLYFPGKREIFDAIMTGLFDRVRGEIRTLPREASGEIPSQLRGNIERVTHLLLDEPLLAKILFNESVGLDPDLDRRLHKFYGQLLDLICRGLKQGQEMGFVREGDIQILSTALLGSLKEIFYQSLLRKELPDRLSLVRELFTFVVSAIASPQIRQELQAAV